MSIILYYWLVQWRSVFFNINTGKGRVRWLSRKPTKCQGWANRHKGIWYALYNSAAGLVFQVGNKSWDMKSYDCSHRFQGEKCIFEIHKSGKIEYSLEYDAYRSKDVTFDAIDLETSDYFYWVSLVWNDSSLKAQFASSWEVVTT